VLRPNAERKSRSLGLWLHRGLLCFGVLRLKDVVDSPLFGPKLLLPATDVGDDAASIDTAIFSDLSRSVEGSLDRCAVITLLHEEPLNGKAKAWHKRQLRLQRRCMSQTRADVPPIGCRLSPHTRACSLCSQTTTRSSGLPFNGCHPRNPCNYMNHYTFTGPVGMEGWVGLVGWSVADTLLTKWSHVNRISGVYWGKFASQRPTF